MQDVARDIVTNASMGNLRASPVSQLESGKTDSAAQSIARRAIQPHLGDSSAASHTRHSMDEIPSIIEGDEAMQDVARDIVTNASMGHLRASPVSQLESGKTDSAAQSIARRAIEPHLADSSAASHTRHSMDEIPSVIAGDEAVQDVARDIVTNASMGHLRASPVSQLESENTDSAARSIARRAIEPHLADSSAASNSKHSMDEIPSSQVEARSDMHQLKEEAGSDGYPAAQGVAREVIASATSRGTAEPHPATVQEQMHSEAEGYATAQGVARDCVASARQAPSPASPHSQVQSETVDSVAAQFVARQAVEPYRDGTGHPHPRHEVEVVEGSSGGATHDAIAHDTDSVVAQSITRQLVAMRQVEARSDMDHLKEEAGSDGYPAAQGVAREVIASATSRGIAEPHPATVQEQMHSEAEGYATAQVVARDCVTSAIQAPSPASPHSQVQSETVDSVAAQFVARQAVEPYRDGTGHPHPRHGVEVVEGSSGGASHDAIAHDTDSVVAQSITRQLVAMRQVEARSDMDHLKEEAGSDGYPAAQGVAREVIASATSRGIAEPHPATVQEQMHSEAEGYATAQVVARDCVTSAIQAPSPASPHSQVQSETVDSVAAQFVARQAVEPYRDSTGHPHPRHGVEVVEGSSGGASHDAVSHGTDSVAAQSITRQLVAMSQVEARSDMDHLKEEAGSDGYPAAQGVAREVIASATSRGIAEPHPATVQEQMHSEAEGYATAQVVARDCVTSAIQAPSPASPHSQVQSETVDSVAAQFVARQAVEPYRDGTGHPHPRHGVEVVEGSSGGATHDAISHDTDSVVAQSITRQLVAMSQVEARSDMDHLKEEAGSDGYPAAQGVAREVIASATSRGIAEPHPATVQEQMHSEVEGYSTAQVVARDCVTSAIQAPSPASPHSQVQSETVDSVAAQFVARQAVEPYRDSTGHPHPRHGVEVVEGSSGGATHDAISHDTDSVVAQSITRQLVAMSQVEARSDMDHLQEEAGSDGYPAAQGVAREVIASATSRGIAEPHPATVQEQMHSEAEGYATAQVVARDCVTSAIQAPSPASPHSQVQSEAVDSPSAGIIAGEAVKQA